MLSLPPSVGRHHLARRLRFGTRFTFPEPQHHWMQVEATFTELAPRRSSSA